MKEKTFSPVVVFAFNRPDSLRNTITTLAANAEASSTDLYIFVDGPRESKEGEAAKVEAVRSYVATITGFRSVTHSFSETNKGLAPSIIAGVTKVLSHHPSAIIVEDDLVVASNFLAFMNEMLVRHEKDARIMQVTGFGPKVRRPKDYKWDVYLSERGHPWTWGTWADRWATVDWDVKDFKELKASRKLRRKFCKRGSDLYKMLADWRKGKNQSWFIRFNYSMYKQGRYCVCPIQSLVINEGFSADATNCKSYNRYKVDFDEKHYGPFALPVEPLQPDERLMRESVKYWTIRYRIYGKIMTYLRKLKR